MPEVTLLTCEEDVRQAFDALGTSPSATGTQLSAIIDHAFDTEGRSGFDIIHMEDKGERMKEVLWTMGPSSGYHVKGDYLSYPIVHLRGDETTESFCTGKDARCDKLFLAVYGTVAAMFPESLVYSNHGNYSDVMKSIAVAIPQFVAEWKTNGGGDEKTYYYVDRRLDYDEKGWLTREERMVRTVMGSWRKVDDEKVNKNGGITRQSERLKIRRALRRLRK
jgi:hypothetical protein